MKRQRIEHQIFQAHMPPHSPEKMTPKSLTNSNPYKICKQQFFFDAAGVKAAGQQKKTATSYHKRGKHCYCLLISCVGKCPHKFCLNCSAHGLECKKDRFCPYKKGVPEKRGKSVVKWWAAPEGVSY